MKHVDWSRHPWWLRPLTAIGLGITAGLLLILAINQLATGPAMVVIIAMVIASAIFCVWMLYDLRRMRLRFEQQVAEWEREFNR